MGNRGFALAFVVAASLVLASPVSAQSGPPECVGDTTAADVPQLPGPPLHFGINPRAVTGQVGTLPAEAVPEDPDRHLAKLIELRAPGSPFALRLTRFFWRDREQGFERFLAMADRYTSNGFLVELQVRYAPDESQEGDIAAWVEHVREVVRRFGSNPRVVGLQIANEVNITFSPDSSDGAFEGAREALVRGVIAAKDEAQRLGHDQLRIGFNWAYRLDPATETSFWSSLRDRGGPEFVAALDFIGLDAYPGTVFPPAEATLEDYRDGMVNAMSAIRCYATIPGIPMSVPIEFGENGWPTFGGRSYDDQAAILSTMVQAAHDFRGTYNVRDYRWFNLRDSKTGDAGIFQNAGLLEDDYDYKPAFFAYRDLIAQLGVREDLPAAQPAQPRPRPRLRLRLSYRRGASGCASSGVRARVEGQDRRQALRAGFRRGRRLVARDVRRPFGRVIDPGPRPGSGARTQMARIGVRLTDGRLVRMSRSYRLCAGRATLRRRALPRFTG